MQLRVIFIIGVCVFSALAFALQGAALEALVPASMAGFTLGMEVGYRICVGRWMGRS